MKNGNDNHEVQGSNSTNHSSCKPQTPRQEDAIETLVPLEAQRNELAQLTGELLAYRWLRERGVATRK